MEARSCIPEDTCSGNHAAAPPETPACNLTRQQLSPLAVLDPKGTDRMALDSKALNQYLQSDLIDVCQRAPQAALPQLP